MTGERAPLSEDLYDELPCGYLATRDDGQITRANLTFEQWTGHERDSLRGRRFSDLLTPGSAIYHETHYAPLLRMQGTVREIAFELVRADGEILPVLVNSNVRGENVHTTIFDASDRRSYERELLIERQRAERLERRATFLSEAGGALAEATDLRERAQRLAELLVPERAEGAAVSVCEPSLSATAGVGTGDDRLRRAMDEALRTRSSRLGAGDGAAAAPVAAVPLIVGDRLIGVLGVIRKQHVDGISATEMPLLQELGERAAMALENARLYEHQREVAHTLQRSMLAGAPPSHPRCAIGTHYAPAEDSLEVGGDWHDAFFLGDERLAVVVGDVVGRGLEAATMMGQLRSALRALAGAGLGPAGVLESLDVFVERNGVGRGATVAYAELDLRSGVLALACAGHPPPVLVRPDAAPELLWEGRSAPLGAYIGPTTRAQGEVTLPRGARVLLYTDGLVERRDRPLDEGLEYLMRAFEDVDAIAMAEVGEVLTAEMLAPGHGADDVCLLALAFGSGQPFEREMEADAARLHGLRADLRSWLSERGVGGEDRDAVVLACSETAANAIEHAYLDGSGALSVVADTVPGEVTMAVCDMGAWRIPGSHGRGRGLRIVEHVMDEVVLDRGRGTRVTMRRRLREPLRV